MSDNSIPGPSSKPYQSPSHSNSTIPVPTSNSTTPVPRSVDGPIIIPTILHADGIKEVPHFFELCQIDDLIVLIGK